jgi:hypothetical protein
MRHLGHDFSTFRDIYKYLYHSYTATNIFSLSIHYVFARDSHYALEESHLCYISATQHLILKDGCAILEHFISHPSSLYSVILFSILLKYPSDTDILHLGI